MRECDVLVIGGGIVGCAAAYRLASAGARVVQVCADEPGDATAAAAGGIQPGVETRMPAQWYPLAFRAADHFRSLVRALAEEGESDTGYAVTGSLLLATEEEDEERLRAAEAVIADRAEEHRDDIGTVSPVAPGEAMDILPFLGPRVFGIHTTGGARVDGNRVRNALRSATRRKGGVILDGVARLEVEGGRVRGATVGRRRIGAGSVVVAAGAWTDRVLRPTGTTLPVSPQRGQLVHLRSVPPMTVPAGGDGPIVRTFGTSYLLPFPDRVVVGATRENDVGFDHRTTAGGLVEVLRQAFAYAPGLARSAIIESRSGLRPLSPDGLPILGELSAVTGVWIAGGLGASGLMMGPYAGAVVADLAMGGQAPFDLSPYSPRRF